MRKIDPAEYQKRLDRITELFSGMVREADAKSLMRCPYRDRHDDCTAAIRCRNQRPPREGAKLQQCGHDGGLDYRTAWESNPDSYPRAKERVKRIREEAAARRANGAPKAPER